MKTIQMSIDDELLKQLDRTIKKLNVTRSAFIRESIAFYLKQRKIVEMEEKHKIGYEKKPVNIEEFAVAEGDQNIG